MKVILTIQILNFFKELCVPFSCIDSFAFDKIKLRCAFTKYTTQNSITKSQTMSNSLYIELCIKCDRAPRSDSEMHQ